MIPSDLNCCRVCLGTSEEKSLITDSIIQQKFSYSTHLQIEENDGLPKFICGKCKAHLDIAHDLISRAVESDRRLREFAKTNAEIIVPDETEEIFIKEEEEMQTYGQEFHVHGYSILVAPDQNDDVDVIQSSVVPEVVYGEPEAEERVAQQPDYTYRIVERRVGLPPVKKKRKNSHFVCSQCTKVYAKKASLDRHFMSKHEGIRPYACEFCGKRFTQKHSVKLHSQIHIGETPFECTICQLKFRRKNSLTMHNEACHKGTTSAPEICTYPDCDRAFSSKRALQTHKKTHQVVS